MDKWRDYFWYLLPSPFKIVSKKLNQWYFFLKVLGEEYDKVQSDLERAVDETTIATCSDIMLPYFAEDKGLYRYSGENNDSFRSRIAMHDELESLGGTKDGIILAVKTAGFQKVEHYWFPVITGDDTRWAEFYLYVYDALENNVTADFDNLKKYVRDVKASESQDNYRFVCTAECIWQINVEGSMITEEDIFYFDGSYCFDGGRTFQSGKVEEIVL